jgi:hypothetical protein
MSLNEHELYTHVKSPNEKTLISMKKKLTIALLTLISFQPFAQQTPADSLREKGQLNEAIEQYAIQYAANPDNKDNTYNYACALSLSEQIDSAFHYLNISLIADTTARPLNDPDFYFMLDDPRWKVLENEMIKRIEEAFFKYKHPDLVKELWRMKIKDQAFYFHEDLMDDQLFRSAIWELKRKLNEQNLTRLKDIIEEFGWPKKSDVGGMAAGTVFLIIQHADLETQKKYLPIMTEAANNNEAQWSSLAMLIDRINMREGKPQIYGSQIKGNNEGKFEVYEIENPEYVNQRRTKVGLGPIEDYVKGWEIEWTLEQKNK